MVMPKHGLVGMSVSELVFRCGNIGTSGSKKKYPGDMVGPYNVIRTYLDWVLVQYVGERFVNKGPQAATSFLIYS